LTAIKVTKEEESAKRSIGVKDLNNKKKRCRQRLNGEWP
jgi:hypothetical protein